jgi:hypothetical protein
MRGSRRLWGSTEISSVVVGSMPPPRFIFVTLDSTNATVITTIRQTNANAPIILFDPKINL